MALYVVSCVLIRQIPERNVEYKSLMKVVVMSEPDTEIEAVEFFKNEFEYSDLVRQAWTMSSEPVFFQIFQHHLKEWTKYIDEAPCDPEPQKGSHLSVVK